MRSISRKEAEFILHDRFGFEKFYDEQRECIEKILSGKRVLMIQKTGFGKSLCYQFPAILFDGLTIIFSPLIALMKDQVLNLNKIGVSAEYINSELSDDEQVEVLNRAIRGQIKILYIAPERLDNGLRNELVDQLTISMIIIDEAHCISVRGHDFRPNYRRIIDLVRKLPKNFPVLATTATATKMAELDIIEQMGENVDVIRGDLMRPNLSLNVELVQSEDEKMAWIGKNLDKIDGSGIIYVGTKANAEIYSKWLNFLGISSTFYHGGIDDVETKNVIFDGFMKNKRKCVVATNALGMGIDKKDIRFIIHTQIPQSPIHYYQEIGRAGRDGKFSNIILFFDKNNDLDLPYNFINNAKPPLNSYKFVLDVVKSDLLGMKDILMKTNLRKGAFNIIIQDLIDQGLVLKNKLRKYEYIGYSKEFDESVLEKTREQKLHELDLMVEYTEQPASNRMRFLCNYLGDRSSNGNVNKVFDLSSFRLSKSELKIWLGKVDEFRAQIFPDLCIKDDNGVVLSGVAASFYGTTKIGKKIHISKYEGGGDFDDYLLELTIKAYYHKYSQYNFDYILFVPPTESGDLVKHFASKISDRLGIPLKDLIRKKKETEPQKKFNNSFSKKANVKDVFELIDENILKGKNILLIDDVYDSGNTLKTLCSLLVKSGVNLVAPLVIAKTVGGDL